MSETRVPTSSTIHEERWTTETVLDHILAIIEANDKRYRQQFLDHGARDEQRFSSIEATMKEGFIAHEKSVAAALTSSDRAVLKAETASEKRFEGVNEFRNTLADQQRSLIPRAESMVLFNALTSRLDILQRVVDSNTLARDSREQGSRIVWGWVVGGFGLVIGLMGFILTMIKMFAEAPILK